MTNILEAINNMVRHKNFAIRAIYTGRNRANSMGDALENYIKDAFANTFDTPSEEIRMEVFNEKFSWLGSQNNPPDIMIKGGDAIEVKKTQSPNSSLALNSSYPKADLRGTSPMITSDCRKCEDWTIKDLIYCVGHTSDAEINSLWMIYGSIYAAKHETYQRIKATISDGVKEIPDVVFSETKELGRVNQVDPLGITNLRIRGMWQIENPRKVFNYLHEPSGKDFELICVIPNDKYFNFPEASRNKLENLEVEGFSIASKNVKNPNNPVKLIECQIIKFLI
ncbi:NgoPII family restriction endonuclease [Portibacter lacus]|uniref:NgoPII family restriction endonuclease n=1 Tax=Portibacter lacus TaxID=1099794 RepID=A0AA37SL91_9BACT|nr:NgoPII family restriction endonuclease [Portibacter lacus]GLR16015.1 hypothetical protein GCM10007940_06300 [Portibacter lacus]